MPLIGIIDLGSNSVRLVVYDAAKPAKAKRARATSDAVENKAEKGAKKPFREIVDKKRIAGLSAYVADGRLTPEGIEAAIAAVQGLARAAENIGCAEVHLFATAVIRNCENSKQAAKGIGKATGLAIDVLSAEDEAHLGFVGAAFGTDIRSGTLIDIGGGSTELTAIRDGKDVHGISIPSGSVSSYAQFVSLILPQPNEEAAIRDAFDAELARVKGLGDFEAKRLYGIGGSVRAASKLYAVAFSGNERHQTLSRCQMEALQGLLEDDPSAFAHAAAKATPERMHTVAPGIIIARALLERLGAESLTVCKYGIREGYLLERVLGL